VDPWWWVPIGLAAWFSVAVLVAPCVGAVLKRCSQTREAIDRHLSEMPGGHEPPRESPMPSALDRSGF
jgi:hypothetical protein